MTEGQTAWYVWASKALTGQGVRGPWYLLDEYTTVTPSMVNLEWRDEELGELLNDNNYPPPKALSVCSLDDLLIFGSCYGAPDSAGEPTAPGPGFAVGKPFNPEGFPPSASAFVTPAEDVRGVHVGNSRMYIITKNRQHIGTLTGGDKTPLVIRPYWQAGGSHRGSGVMCGDVFYASVGDAIIRSVTGQDVDSGFSARVKSVLSPFIPARTFLGYDPRNQWMVVFHSQDYLDVRGKYITKALSFNLKTEKWNTPCILGDGVTDDFVVCGVCTIGERLYFITTDGKVWLWDEGVQTIIGTLGTNFHDFGGSQYTKTIRRVAPTGHFSGDIQLFRNYDFSESPTPSHQFLNPSFNGTHFPVWRPNWHGKSFAMVIIFSDVPAKTRLIDNVAVEVEFRSGAVF